MADFKKLGVGFVSKTKKSGIPCIRVKIDTEVLATVTKEQLENGVLLFKNTSKDGKIYYNLLVPSEETQPQQPQAESNADFTQRMFSQSPQQFSQPLQQPQQPQQEQDIADDMPF